MCRIAEKRLLPKNPSNGQIAVWSAAQKKWVAQDNSGSGFDPSEDQTISGNYNFTKPVQFAQFAGIPDAPAYGHSVYTATSMIESRFFKASGFKHHYDYSDLSADRTIIIPDNSMAILGVTAPIDSTLRNVVSGGTSPLSLSTTIIGSDFDIQFTSNSGYGIKSTDGTRVISITNALLGLNAASTKIGQGTITTNGVLTVKGAGGNIFSGRNSANSEVLSISDLGGISASSSISSLGNVSTTGNFILTSKIRISSSSAGKINITDSVSGAITSLTFGPETILSPMLKVNGTILEVKLGDDSAYTDLNANAISLTSQIVIGASNSFRFSGRSRIYSTSDGTVVLSNNGLSDFSRLQFGGTTALFPAIKRSSTDFQFVTADDSAWINIRANSFIIQSSGTSLTSNTLNLAGYNAMYYSSRIFIDNDNRGVAFNTAGVYLGGNSATVASALLQVDSTTKGFLLPRMNTTQRDGISSPATGLMLFDTSLNFLSVYTSSWENFITNKSNMTVGADYTFAFTDTNANPFATKDLGFKRGSAGVLEITDGSSGCGAIKSCYYQSRDLSGGALATASRMRFGATGMVGDGGLTALGIDTQLAVEVDSTILYIPCSTTQFS